MKTGVIGNFNEFDDEQNGIYLDMFYAYTDIELAEAYFRELKIGITGVRMQMIYLIALKQVLSERFGDSPIEFNGAVLEL